MTEITISFAHSGKQYYSGKQISPLDCQKYGLSPYLPSPALIEAFNLAIFLEKRPLLLKGEPGCGKTTLAQAVAYELGLPYEAWYIKSTTRARDGLYTAARELAKVLSKRVEQEDMAELLSLTSLLETLATPLTEAGLEPLIVYCRGIMSFVSGNWKRATEHFSQLLPEAYSVLQMIGVELNIPLTVDISSCSKGLFNCCLACNLLRDK